MEPVWAEIWVASGIVHGFHVGPKPIAHMGFRQDYTRFKMGPSWAKQTRPILVPALSSMWDLHGTSMGWNMGCRWDCPWVPCGPQINCPCEFKAGFTLGPSWAKQTRPILVPALGPMWDLHRRVWTEIWVAGGIVYRFHVGPMLIGCVGLMQDYTSC